MDNIKLKESLTRDVAVSSGLPPPSQVLNQSAEYQVIEKAAQLLKRVEQHWKKSLFQNRLQFSPISESLNSSESEHYIEKLAAIKFKDASFRNKVPFAASEAGRQKVSQEFRREASLEQNLLMSYDVVSNYFDLIGSKSVNKTNNPGSARARENEHFPSKCQRCLDKAAKAQSEAQKKSVLVLPKQQYVLKQNTYGRRGGLFKQTRGGGASMQVSPRSTDSIPTSRTCPSAYSSPRNKSNLSGARTRMSLSNPDLRNIKIKEYGGSRYHNTSKCCHNVCGTEHLNNKMRESLNMSEVVTDDDHQDAINASNVSVVNIKSNNQDGSTIPEVNPRKISSAPDKMIIIQHLPQVDIRPELSKQTGPVISIEAESTAKEEKDPRNNNIGVFNYIHKNKPKYPQKDMKPLSDFSNYRRLLGNNGCTEEESFAAQLELRSVAENFIYRLKKNDNPSGLVLVSTLLRLMDEVNELIDSHLSGSASQPIDSNLPPRMEMVSDLLSDELKTWGAQHPSHYQSLNNIIHHLILDIHFAKNGNFIIKELINEASTSQNLNLSMSKKSSILKSGKSMPSFYHSGRQRHISLSGESNYEKEKGEATYRSTYSEEMSLSDKLLQENALKVQRLEKAYKINQRVRILQNKEEMRKIKESESKKSSKEELKNSSASEVTDVEDKADQSEESHNSKRLQSSYGSSSNSSHPVVAIISPSQNDSVEEEDKTISERASEAEDKSVAEDLEDEVKSEDAPEEDNDEEEEVPSKPSEEVISKEQSDKPISDVEEEVEEVLSETSQAAEEKQKDLAASDYDEDFEPDVTENPSQSATASTHQDKEKVGKRSHSRIVGIDEVCQTDSIAFLLESTKLKQGKTDRGIISSGGKENDVSKRYDNKHPLVDNFEDCKDEESSNASVTGRQTHLWHNSKQKRYRKINVKPVENIENEDSSQTLKNDKEDENNFVKVHVRDELGEIILSYAGSKQTTGIKSASSKKEEKTLPRIDFNQYDDTKTKLPTVNSINNYIENERKVLESLTSNVLKELLDNKIQEILSRYTVNDNLKNNSVDNNDRPSISGASHNKEQSTQTASKQNELKLGSSKQNESRLDSDNFHKFEVEPNEDYKDEDIFQLKSPSVQLDIDKTLRRAKAIDKEESLSGNVITTGANEVELENIDEPSCSKPITMKDDELNGCSPEVKLLISMVEDLDSSDVEYCEASIKHLAEDELERQHEVTNKQLRLHHFNSDEFLVYPRLNPQPSDIEILQYSKDEVNHKAPQESKILEGVMPKGNLENISSERNLFRSVATECDLKDLERLHPLPESTQNLVKTIFSSSSTQTEANTRLAKPFTLASVNNLVDLIEISCSQSSSSGSNSRKAISEQDMSKILPVMSQSDRFQKESILEGSQIEPLISRSSQTKTDQSEPSSMAHSERNSPNLFIHLNHRMGIGGENIDFSEQNDEISSTSNETEHSSPTETFDSQSRLTGPIKRVLEVSAARAAAWSSSTESTSDDERFFILNQPPVSDDDVLDDLEQLVDYLKSSKSCASKVRIRQCSRHKKT